MLRAASAVIRSNWILFAMLSALSAAGFYSLRAADTVARSVQLEDHPHHCTTSLYGVACH